jgi:transposase
MSKPSRTVFCDDVALKALKELVARRTAPAGIVQRAKIILACIAGETVQGIVQQLKTSPATVMRWKGRFIESGLQGLFDKARSGRPTQIDLEFKKAVLEKLEQEPPEGFGQWDGPLLAQHLGFPVHSVWKLLRQERISLARKRSWCISTDPEFASKAADVVGLYLAPPENAFVICIDEKPNIQALERRTGYAISSDKKLIQGIESTYTRNGTVNLFAALSVASGHIHGKVTPPGEKTKKGFLNFMDDLLVHLPKSSEYHVIVDNHSIHKRHGAWLENHPNVFFHYTPTSASWLNMVEIWFGILTRKSLRKKSFSSTGDLAAHIEAFTAAYNETARPFVWKKREVKGSQLKNIARNFNN